MSVSKRPSYYWNGPPSHWHGKVHYWHTPSYLWEGVAFVFVLMFAAYIVATLFYL
jgi:hypothetical protein